MQLSAATGRKDSLPTEAQWEYAASGGNRNNGYKYSGSNRLADVAWYKGNSEQSSHPVGAKLPSELGIHDMSGNVWEWCEDYFNNKTDRVLCGGSWSVVAEGCLVTCRGVGTQAIRRSAVGFRVVLVP
jgi:formylglycine-generating enzyme required for sulfatase activity